MGVRIREKPKGSKIWWIFVSSGGIRKSKKIGRNKRLANQVSKRIEAEIILQQFDMEHFNKKVPTLTQYARNWFGLPHDQTQHTLNGYRRNIELHVLPKLGNKPIDRLKRGHFKELFDGLISKGKISESNVQNLRSPLSCIYEHAIESGILKENPFVGLKYSKASSVQINLLSEAAAFTFLKSAMKYQGGLFYPHFLTLLRTGMRVGELLGLQWNDIDFGKRQILIQRHIYKGALKKATKNGENRTIDITPHVSETLHSLKVDKSKAALRAGKKFSEWCFAHNGATKPISVTTLARALSSILMGVGLPKMRLHDLRHCYATTRLLKGHNIMDVSYQLGHSNISITHKIYTHWIPGKFRDQTDNLDGSFRAGSGFH